MADFKDNLTVGEEVFIPGDMRPHTYRGFEGPRPRRCAVGLKGEPEIAWFDRAVVTPAMGRR